MNENFIMSQNGPFYHHLMLKIRNEEWQGMEKEDDLDHFQQLEERVLSLINNINTLKNENKILKEKVQKQEETISGLNRETLSLKGARDTARERMIGLLEKIKQIDVTV